MGVGSPVRGRGDHSKFESGAGLTRGRRKGAKAGGPQISPPGLLIYSSLAAGKAGKDSLSHPPEQPLGVCVCGGGNMVGGSSLSSLLQGTQEICLPCPPGE